MRLGNEEKTKIQSALISLADWDVSVYHDEGDSQYHSALECLEYDDNCRLLLLLHMDLPKVEAVACAALLRGITASVGSITSDPTLVIARICDQIKEILPDREIPLLGVHVQPHKHMLTTFDIGHAEPLLRKCRNGKTELKWVKQDKVWMERKGGSITGAVCPMEKGDSMVLISDHQARICRKDKVLMSALERIRDQRALESSVEFGDYLRNNHAERQRPSTTIIWITRLN